jgi:hypothetical protein
MVRAETACRKKMKRLNDARPLIRQLFRTEIDLVSDLRNKTLQSSEKGEDWRTNFLARSHKVY